MTPDFIGPRDWDNIEFVVLDVDGTLYRQGPLRLRMAQEILLHAVSNWSFETIAVLRTYRRIRERLSNQEVPDFEATLIAETAAATDYSPDTVRAMVTEWIEQRPLRHLGGYRYPLLLEFFAGLRRKGKVIGILSDYPGTEKLEALGLAADHIVSAGDKGIGLLKPHPRGLETLMAAARTRAGATLLIGDRVERDGLVARRAGVKALIRSSKPIEGWQTFAGFDDPLFAPVLEA